MLLNNRKLASLLSDKVTFDLNKTQAEKLLDLLVELMSSNLNKGNKVKFNKFGTFEKKIRVGRKCISPKDNVTEIFVPSIDVIKFKASSTLKQYIRTYIK